MVSTLLKARSHWTEGHKKATAILHNVTRVWLRSNKKVSKVLPSVKEIVHSDTLDVSECTNECEKYNIILDHRDVQTQVLVRQCHLHNVVNLYASFLLFNNLAR